MSLLPNVDPDGLLEYSVVYTDRALNHMSAKFIKVMNDISSTLKTTYNARSAIIVPGSGTFGMEAVARQFAHDKKCMVIRNGFFSFRWTQIFDAGRIPSESKVLKAQRVAGWTGAGPAPFAPAPLAEVLAAIAEFKPDFVFAPHVETASGIVLPDEYITAVAAAVHAVGGMMVLDCIASGCVWVDMAATGVDVLISAPQKGWSGTPCCAFVMLSPAAREAINTTTSSSFAADLKKWLSIMETYEGGGHAYHATMPTDSLCSIRDVLLECATYGMDRLKEEQLALGHEMRRAMEARGITSVAAEGFQAAGVVVSYTADPMMKSGKKMAQVGLQIAGGVPLQCDEGADFSSFRIGLFGLEKMHNRERTVGAFLKALDTCGL